MPRASKTDAAGNQADIAKTYEYLWFSMVLEGWRVILEAWRSSGLSCWHTGWQLAGWLTDWLVVAGAGWGADWPQGPPELREAGRGKLIPCLGEPRTTIYQES